MYQPWSVTFETSRPPSAAYAVHSQLCEEFVNAMAAVTIGITSRMTLNNLRGLVEEYPV